MGCSSRLAGAWSLPVVIDAVSCTHGLLDDIRTHIDRERQERFNKIQLFDAIAWVHQLLPSLHIERKLASVVEHVGRTETRQRALDHGAIGFLYKPFDAADLLGAIQPALKSLRRI